MSSILLALISIDFLLLYRYVGANTLLDETAAVAVWSLEIEYYFKKLIGVFWPSRSFEYTSCFDTLETLERMVAGFILYCAL